MVSSMIHLAIAKEVNKEIRRDNRKLYIDTIALDISKLIGENKANSHFLDSDNTNISNLDNVKKFISFFKEIIINNINDIMKGDN